MLYEKWRPLFYICVRECLCLCFGFLMTTITQECCEQYWTSSGGSTPRSSCCAATYHPSQKLPKLDEPDMRDELISDILLKTPSHGRAKVGRPVLTNIQQLCTDPECSLNDLPGAIDDRDEWREKVRKIRAGGVTWWWWWKLFSELLLMYRKKNYNWIIQESHYLSKYFLIKFNNFYKIWRRPKDVETEMMLI